MQIWPHSATLSEVGGAQAGSGPGLGGPQAGGMAGMMPSPNAGEVLLNRAETAALAAFEGEEDPQHGLRRAQAESGLSRVQLQILKRRADHLSSKGYTLKGPNFVKKALAQSPDEPGLTRKGIKGEDDVDVNQPAKAAKGATTKTTAKAKGTTAKKTTTTTVRKKSKAKESNGTALLDRSPDYVFQDLYGCADLDDYRKPTPNSMSQPETGEDAKETNSATTLAAMLMKRRRAKREA
jgi:hypothetical protein